MKHIISILLLSSLAVIGQQTVELPVKMTVSFPAGNNAPIVRKKVVLNTSVVTPQPLGTSLVKRITGPTQFTLSAFPADSEVMLEIWNPSRFRITWPSGIQVIGAPLPTNSVRACVIFSETLGELWAYSTVQ